MPQSTFNEFRLPYCQVQFFYRINVIKVVFTQKTLLSIENLNNLQKAIDQLTEGKVHKMMTNMSDKVTPTKEAYDFYGNIERAKTLSKEAFVLSSPTLKMAANFYFKIKKPKISSKVFETETQAMDWLLEP